MTRRAVARGVPQHWSALYHREWCVCMEALFANNYKVTNHFSFMMRLLCSWGRASGAVSLLQAYVTCDEAPPPRALLNSLSYAGAAIARERTRGNRSAWTAYHELVLKLLIAGASATRVPATGHAFIYYALNTNDFTSLALLYVLTDMTPTTVIRSEAQPYLKATVEELAVCPTTRMALHAYRSFVHSSGWAALLKSGVPMYALQLLLDGMKVTPHGCVEAYMRCACDKLTAGWNAFLLGDHSSDECDEVHGHLKKARLALSSSSLTIAECKRIGALFPDAITSTWYVDVSLPISAAPRRSYPPAAYAAIETALLCVRRHLPAELGLLIASSFCR